MATIPTKPDVDATTPRSAASVPAWPRAQGPSPAVSNNSSQQGSSENRHSPQGEGAEKPSQRNALQALLAFSALHEQVRRRKALAAPHQGFDDSTAVAEFEEGERFVLDEVLQ